MKEVLAKSVVPTDEQRQVIQHPDGHHGRVLSVAGSGKTMVGPKFGRQRGELSFDTFPLSPRSNRT